MRRQAFRPGGSRPSGSDVYTILMLLLLPLCACSPFPQPNSFAMLPPTATTSSSSSSSSSSNDDLAGPLQRRDPDEHVVLCDCHKGDKDLSSQMAYFKREPNDKPEDIAVVATPSGMSRVWTNAQTTGFFTATGVTFTADLGPQVDEGRFAGLGRNDYTSFTCWRRWRQDLYVYDGNTCSQVYDCTHELAPTNETVAGPTSAPGSDGKSTSGGDAGGSAKAKSGLAPGAEAAIIAGVVVGILIAVVAGVLLFLRWYRLRKGEESAAETTEEGKKRWGFLPALFRRKKEQPAETNEAPNEEEKDPMALPVGMYELQGNYHGNEMYEEMFDMLDGNARAELAGQRLTREARNVREEPGTAEEASRRKSKEENKRQSKEEEPKT